MTSFIEQKFNIPALKGISAKTIEEHLKLYAGYVENANILLESPIDKRFGFEYNGMRNHEVYFKSLEKATPISENLKKIFTDKFLEDFKALALTRGVGWAMVYFDRKDKRLLTAWVDEQHIGQLQDCALILALDMWEHSYVADYAPSGKKQYIEDFFANLDWSYIENNFTTNNS